MPITYFIVNDNDVMRFLNLIQNKIVIVHNIIEQKLQILSFTKV